MFQLLLVGTFGAAGAICRYLTSLACIRWLGAHSAWATLSVNVLGCFILGLLMEMVLSEPGRLHMHTHPALTAGFLGAFTTFSTFGYETIRYADQGEWALAGMNVAGNIVLGLLAAGAGLGVGRLLAA